MPISEFPGVYRSYGTQVAETPPPWRKLKLLGRGKILTLPRGWLDSSGCCSGYRFRWGWKELSRDRRSPWFFTPYNSEQLLAKPRYAILSLVPLPIPPLSHAFDFAPQEIWLTCSGFGRARWGHHE